MAESLSLGRHPPIRVLHVVESMGTGVLEVVRTIAERHVAAGIPTGIAYGARPETPSDLALTLDPRIRLFPLQWSRRTPRAQLSAYSGLRSALASFDPTVVHLHSSFAAGVGMLAVRGRRPTIISPHAYAFTMRSLSPPARAAVRWVEARLACRCTVVGAVSHSEGREASRELGASRVVVVQNGISELDAPSQRTPPPADRRPRVIAAGRIGAQRQPEAVAQILGAVRDVADVAWIGAAPPSTNADRPLRDAGIPITGWVDRERVMRELAEADVYLHFSAWDGQAISLLEALAQDVAIVASDIEAAREVVPPTCLAATPAAAIKRIRQLLSDGSAMHRHLEAQREVRPRFSARRMADRWSVVYGELVTVPA